MKKYAVIAAVVMALAPLGAQAAVSTVTFASSTTQTSTISSLFGVSNLSASSFADASTPILVTSSATAKTVQVVPAPNDSFATLGFSTNWPANPFGAGTAVQPYVWNAVGQKGNAVQVFGIVKGDADTDNRTLFNGSFVDGVTAGILGSDPRMLVVSGSVTGKLDSGLLTALGLPANVSPYATGMVTAILVNDQPITNNLQLSGNVTSIAMTMTIVPEPGSLITLTLGLGAFAGLLRRKKA